MGQIDGERGGRREREGERVMEEERKGGRDGERGWGDKERLVIWG